MIARFALLTLVSFGLGMVIPAPEVAPVAEQQKPEPEEVVTLPVETIDAEGNVVMTYKNGPANRGAISRSEPVQKRAEMSDLQSRHVI